MLTASYICFAVAIVSFLGMVVYSVTTKEYEGGWGTSSKHIKQDQQGSLQHTMTIGKVQQTPAPNNTYQGTPVSSGGGGWLNMFK
jgi:hypothetical protein